MSNDMPDVIYVIDERLNEQNSLGVYSHYYNNGRAKYYSESHVQQLIKEAEQRQREKCAYQLFKFRSELYGRVPAAVLVNLEQAILNAGGE